MPLHLFLSYHTRIFKSSGEDDKFLPILPCQLALKQFYIFRDHFYIRFIFTDIKHTISYARFTCDLIQAVICCCECKGFASIFICLNSSVFDISNDAKFNITISENHLLLLIYILHPDTGI